MATGFNAGDILISIKADISDLQRGLGEAQKGSQQFGEGFSNVANKIATGLGVAGAGLTAFAANALNKTVDFTKSSKSLGREIGATTEEASRLLFVGQHMGLGIEELSVTFGIFAKKIVAATDATSADRLAHEKLQIEYQKTEREIQNVTQDIKVHGDKTGDLGLKLRELNNTLATEKDSLEKTSNAFDKIGVSTTDATGKQKGFEQILLEVADKFKAMPNGIDKTALSMQLFGRSGKELLPILNLGSQGIADLEKEADKLGITLTTKNLAAVNEYIKSQKALKASTEGLTLAVGIATAPVMTKFNEKIADLLKGLLQTKGPIHDLTVGFLAFGGPVLVGAAGVISFVANLHQAWPIIKAVTNVTKLWTAAQVLLDIALSANPIGIIIIAIGLFIAILVTAYLKSETFRDVVNAVFHSVWVVIQSVFNWVKDHWPMLLGILTGPFGAALIFIIQHRDQIMGVIRSIPGQIGSALGGLWGAITGPFRDAFNWVKNEAQKVSDSVKRALNPMQRHSPSVVDLVEMGTTAITDQYSQMFNKIHGMASQFSMARSVVNSAHTVNTSISGPINIGSQTDADYFFKRLTRGQELAKQGIPIPPGGLG